MRSRFVGKYLSLITLVEYALAVGILVGLVVYVVASIHVLASMDWKATTTFYEFLNRALLVLIGSELSRMMFSHDLPAILELLAFVIARKMVKPELTATDIAIGVLSFIGLALTMRFAFSNRETA